MLSDEKLLAIAQRKELLARVATAYCEGLKKRDISGVPWDENVLVRLPVSKFGSHNPIRGRAQVLKFYAGVVYHSISDVKIRDFHFADDLASVFVRSTIKLVDDYELRAATVFEVNPAGLITEMESHYDSRVTMEKV